MIQISSSQNPRIKSLLLLKDKSRERKKTGTFIIEGVREITLAAKGDYAIDSLFICPELIDSKSLEFVQSLNTLAQFEITEAIYKKIAHRATTEGLLAVARVKNHDLDQLTLNNSNSLVLVAEAPEKPGNVGALLRTADAAGVDAIIIANPKSDLYNPNIVRSSVGCVFTSQIAIGTTQEVIAFLKAKQFKIYSATLQDSQDYLSVDYSGASAIVVGTEADGLSSDWREKATATISIPMRGLIDSMNVSVAAGILLFEAVRQRSL